MKTILNIAKTELKNLFYSPIAWLILIIFTIQANITFLDMFELLLKFADSGRSSSNITTRIFTEPMGARTVFIKIQNNLFLYIPLLTMGLMSREISSGSIKLLFSSPVSSYQIVFGKYFAMLFYGLILIGILSLSVIFGSMGVKNLDVPYLLSGLFGVYLLICAYSAIGLFMSALTSYQVVAAFSTLAILGALNYVGTVGQSIAFVRELTYWLSMSGRTETMISGLLTSEDVMYFLIVVTIFLGFTIVKLEAGRIRKKFVNFGRYALILLIGVVGGFVFSRPTIKSYLDVTANKHNTLRENSQRIVKNIDGKLIITTYVNILGYNMYYGVPIRVKVDMERFEKYIRFKPDIELKYVYYWDTPSNNPYIYSRYPDDSEAEMAKKVADLYDIDFNEVLGPDQVKGMGLKEEDNVFVRLVEHQDGEKTFLRIFKDMQVMPDEKEITVALKRVDKRSITVGFVKGHGEREVFGTGDADYSRVSVLKNYRESLINNGFDFEEIDLSHGDVPASIDILVVADARSPLSELEQKRLYSFIGNGGNLLIAAEPNRREHLAPLAKHIGVEFIDGVIVEPSENFSPTLVINNLTPKIQEEISFVFERMAIRNEKVTTLEGMGLEYELAKEKGYAVTPLLQTKWRGCWNELESTNFEGDSLVQNTDVGEIQKPYEMAVALSKQKAGKVQRIVVLGDADCWSNSEAFMQREDLETNNPRFMMGIFEWLSNSEFPVDVRKPQFQDNGFKISQSTIKIWKIVLVWLLPLGIAITYLSIWLTRRKK
ncbi:Gldg family protein [Flagellimonas sp. SN16]|uniref:Gldg family protein n=1 Tax=Flagellimonas sp. SN16 TaxID=3415142 RepID=UPI003C398469